MLYLKIGFMKAFKAFIRVKRRQERENKKQHCTIEITVPGTVPIITQHKSNMFTSRIYNKTKTNHFENFDVLLYFRCK